MRFEPDQVLVQKGEYGSWFGVLLSGTMKVVITPTFSITMQAGAIVGEMCIFSRESVRACRYHRTTWVWVRTGHCTRTQLLSDAPSGIVCPHTTLSCAQVRSASLMGDEEGLIATMLVSELEPFMASAPVPGAALLRAMGHAALKKNQDNARRARFTDLPTMFVDPVWHVT